MLFKKAILYRNVDVRIHIIELIYITIYIAKSSGNPFQPLLSWCADGKRLWKSMANYSNLKCIYYLACWLNVNIWVIMRKTAIQWILYNLWFFFYTFVLINYFIPLSDILFYINSLWGTPRLYIVVYYIAETPITLWSENRNATREIVFFLQNNELNIWYDILRYALGNCS